MNLGDPPDFPIRTKPLTPNERISGNMKEALGTGSARDGRIGFHGWPPDAPRRTPAPLSGLAGLNGKSK
jgi:hypothetical protein